MSGPKKHALARTARNQITLLLVATIILLGVVWILSDLIDFQRDIKDRREQFLNNRKALLKSEVQGAIQYIDFMRNQTETRLKENIRQRVYEAHAIAANLYRRHRRDKAPEEIQHMVREALRPIRYSQARGYYFATNLNGVEELFADRPEMEGENLLEFRDTQGQFVIRDMIALARDQGEGFYTYYWTKPNEEGDGFPKIAFVKRFEPFNWLIGTGEYIDDVRADIQREVLDWIEKIRFGRDGYLFVNRFDGMSLAGPGRGHNHIGLTDPNGVQVVRELINQARAGGGFVSYVMPRIENKKAAPKLSYVEPVPDWGWCVGSGVYVDEIEDEIQARTLVVQKAIIVHTVLIGVVLVLVFFMARLLSGRLRIRAPRCEGYVVCGTGNAGRVGQPHGRSPPAGRGGPVGFPGELPGPVRPRPGHVPVHRSFQQSDHPVQPDPG
jgi:signal transduction histidine kinase